ncbi:hypothetical protein H1R20_g4415, partial [Candolleomyces eurysporus]
MEIDVDEVIGEYKEGHNLYYFARYREGIAHKFPGNVFAKKYPNLIDAFKKAKKSPGFKHANFDPSASYVHPLSRVKMTLSFSRNRDKAKVSTSATAHSLPSNIEYVPDSDEDQGEASEEESDGYTESTGPRRVTRQPKLPFSPRKARSQRLIALDDSESERGSSRPERRVTRARAVKLKLASDNSDFEDDDGSDYATMKKSKGKKRKRGSDDEFDYSDDEDRYNALGGWVRCLKCPVAAHWSCIAGTQRDEILKAAREKDRRDCEASGNDPEQLARRRSLAVEETTEFVCGSCNKGGICVGCMEMIPPPGEHLVDANGDVEMADASNEAQPELGMARQLNFRCLTCKRVAHYNHLPIPRSLPPNSKLSKIAIYYQHSKSWLCSDCASYQYPLDKIIAWRPYPPDAKEPPRAPNSVPNYKEQLPREYLVKWMDRSYRRTSWVPHMWLVSTNPAKLKNFLSGGTKVELLKEVPDDDASSGGIGTPFEIGADTRASSSNPAAVTAFGPLDALPDAERRIIPAWKTVDRVLDCLIWSKSDKKKGKGRQKRMVVSDDEDVDMEDEMPEELKAIYEQGEEPDSDHTLGIADWERKMRASLGEEDIDKVVWIFVKWGDLGYDEASWDSPPRRGEPGYDAFTTAFRRFINSRDVLVPELSRKDAVAFDKRPKDEFRRKHALKDPAGLELDQDKSLKLMPFQVDGFNWLCNNWWNHQPCILADDMGLGKTVQMSTFLGTIATKFNAFPALVVVPNSTITNWVREFERWAPSLRVVPFYGDKKARDVIKQFELYHEKVPKNYTNAKFHVLVTTYEAVINPKDFGVIFKKQPRWEVMVIDEGQRLKSDSSLLFKKLNELNSVHRVIMTGTPLNNNIRELFNLMNFLDPNEWSDLEALEKEHEELNEELIKSLHTRLRPYFLRRLKSEVLQLPPKNEVIVPVSMAPLQRQVYRSILSHNIDLLKGLTQPSRGGPSKGRLNNILMHLRKCLQHPYLYSDNIEPMGLSASETHDKLIYASAKFRLLKSLLPKLKARGHRVLLFSQFVLALDIIEDFLRGEGFKFLRLDGNTKGTERQKCMDEYNKPDSEYFIFLLTTRAGGVGINLFSADTVIIFDPDFNPHQDLQAIARAYRYGQKKTCLVFKLMVKDSAEERIMQIGKKKLVLDHLIVQKMDDDEDSPGENMESILTYGAQALFDSEQVAKELVYSDSDIDQLIEKTEKEGDESDAPKESGLAFSFAKVWSADKDQLEDVADEDQVDSWAQTLQKINEVRDKERQEEIAVSGRGARRKAADVAKTKMVSGPNEEPSPAKRKAAKETVSDASEYGSPEGSDNEMSVSGSEGEPEDGDFMMSIDKRKGKGKKRANFIDAADSIDDTNGINNANRTNDANRMNDANGINDTSMDSEEDIIACGLCGSRHGVQQCPMTDSSQNLAEYREMLMLHGDDEPWEERIAAIYAIDEILKSRGQLDLIRGQPLFAIPKQTFIPPTKKPKEATEMVAAHYREKQKMPPPPTAPIQQTSQMAYQQQRSGNMVIRNYTAPADASASSSSFQPPRAGGGVVVNTPASGSGLSSGSKAMAKAKAMMTPTPTPTPGSFSSTGAAGGAATATTSPVSSERCIVCNSPAIHFLKDCPMVLEGPSRVSQLIASFERDSDPKKADAVTTLRRILIKQKKRQQKEETLRTMS